MVFDAGYDLQVYRIRRILKVNTTVEQRREQAVGWRTVL